MFGRLLVLRAVLGAVFALAAVNTVDAEPAAPASLVGHYRIQGSGMIIAIADCGEGQLCGRVAARGQLPEFIPCRLCQAASAVEPLCGAQLMTRLHPTRTGWQGEFFDPRAGIDYALNLWWSKEGASGTTLLTQRYNAPPFLTRSMPKIEAWTPVAPPTTPCGTATPTS
jgi:hypothetical protein